MFGKISYFYNQHGSTRDRKLSTDPDSRASFVGLIKRLYDKNNSNFAKPIILLSNWASSLILLEGWKGKPTPPPLFVVVYCNNLLFNVKIRDLDAHRVSCEKEKVTGSNTTLTCCILPFPSTLYCTSSRPHSVSQNVSKKLHNMYFP